MRDKTTSSPEPIISVVIPAYEMNGIGVEMLKRCLESIQIQSVQNYEVIVSDHSLDDAIQATCGHFSKSMNLKYFCNRRKRGSSSANLNFGIRHASAPVIKILFQDDSLASPMALADALSALANSESKWFACASLHTSDFRNYENLIVPTWNSRVFAGNNSISAPSVIAFEREAFLPFDEDLIWLMDCDFYERMFRKNGLPAISEKVGVNQYLGEHQVTKSVDGATRWKEYSRMIYRHAPLRERFSFTWGRVSRRLQR
jgi:glycosyltransferase involved in cell wall biosynthesis